jgi:cytoskeletal protein RodZ
MRTVGEILSEKRKALDLGLEEIEKETKIRRKYLEAIEKNDFAIIAESTIVKGFIRNYAQALGLEAGSVLAVFRRDFCENQKGQIIPRGMVEPLVEKTFFWTPKATIVTGLSLLILGFVFFFVRQYVGFSSAPPLEVTSPKDDQLFKEKVVVMGKTDKDASVKIDGTLISIAEDGSFKEEIVLPRGENMVVVETANRQGKKRVVSRRVKVE